MIPLHRQCRRCLAPKHVYFALAARPSRPTHLRRVAKDETSPILSALDIFRTLECIDIQCSQFAFHRPDRYLTARTGEDQRMLRQQGEDISGRTRQYRAGKTSGQQPQPQNHGKPKTAQGIFLQVWLPSKIKKRAEQERQQNPYRGDLQADESLRAGSAAIPGQPQMPPPTQMRSDVLLEMAQPICLVTNGSWKFPDE